MTTATSTVVSPASALIVSAMPGVNFTPLASIDRPLEAFKAAGIAFQTDEDDLDVYEIAYFALGAGREFAIMRYSAEPGGRPALLVSDAFLREGDAAELVSVVARALEVPPSAFTWRDERKATAA